MAAPTEVYVDPSIAGNSGAGTVGDPYGDIQHALDTVTQDTTNGDRFNIKAGTDEILTAALSLATYGSPTAAAPCIFQGYTSAAGDGGQGGIDGNGSYAIFSDTAKDYVGLVDLHMHNTGTASGGGIQLGGKISIIRCHVEDMHGGGINLDEEGFIYNCHLEDLGASSFGYAIYCWNETIIAYNYLKVGTDTNTQLIETAGNNCVVSHNILTGITSYTDGIRLYIEGLAMNNSILATSGTGEGIYTSNAFQHYQGILGNLVEGFSGGGGEGVLIQTNSDMKVYANNGAYNNTTHYKDTIGDWCHFYEDNEALGASPFAKSGSDTYANRNTYFAPVDTGNVIGGMPNGQDKGAVQSAAGGGGGLSIVNTRRNMLIGR